MAKRAKGRLRKETVLGTVSMLRIGGLHQRMSLGKAVEWLDASMSVGTNSVLRQHPTCLIALTASEASSHSTALPRATRSWSPSQLTILTIANAAEAALGTQ